MKLIEKGAKLYENGLPTPFGYALSGVIDYNTKDGKIPFLRLKEWDFYQITTPKYSLYAIIGHVSYATSLNCTIFEFESKKTYYVGKMLPFKKVEMDKNASIDSIVSYKDKNFFIEFKKEGKNRSIKMLTTDKTLGECNVDILIEETQKDNILVLTPFKNKKHYYLNQKACLMIARGYANFGEHHYEFKENEAFALLDWGRGVLPFKHQWIWGNGSGIVDGKYFGFNIGIFGNNENGSENIFFYNNKSYKMDKLKIEFDENDVFGDWKYASDDGNFVFTMKPFYDNHTKTKVLWVNNECHQMFGKFNGYIIVQDKKIEIKDFIAFTEIAHNRW